MARDRLHQCENWIFDWSGTLVDDLAMVIDATNHVLRQYGVGELTREEFRARFRLPYAGFYEQVLPGIPLEELEDHFRVGFADSEAAGTTTPLLPYAVDFLEQLLAERKRVFILSSMDAPAFERHAEELGVRHFFEATYAGVLDKRDQIQRILKTHTLDARKTVFLGDMEHDIETARHGGVISLALLTGYQSREELEKSLPDVLAADLGEVQALMKQKSF